jgi:hypothetical protein
VAALPRKSWSTHLDLESNCPGGSFGLVVNGFTAPTLSPTPYTPATAIVLALTLMIIRRISVRRIHAKNEREGTALHSAAGDARKHARMAKRRWTRWCRSSLEFHDSDFNHHNHLNLNNCHSPQPQALTISTCNFHPSS